MRIAFIGGYGHHYLRHALPALDADVAASGDGHDPEAARRWAAKNNITAWHDDPHQLFDEFRPDVVSIGAIYGDNGTIAARALERDIQVVSDKPIAATWEQLQRLRDLTQGNGRTLLTEFNFRAQPEFRAARQAVQDGRIGEVVLVTAQKSYRFGAARPAWYANREDYTGTMLWIASHGIDIVGFCSGQKFGRVTGVQGNVARPDYGTMEDFCIALFELQNGSGALVHADYSRTPGAMTHGDDRLRIAGSRGVVEVRDGRCRLLSGDEPEVDITHTVLTRPVHDELLAALRGESDECYGTQASLETATVLLHARDAADARAWQTCQTA